MLAAIVAFFAVRQPEPAREGERVSDQATLCYAYWTGAQELQSWETHLRNAQALRNRFRVATADRWQEPDFHQEIESRATFQLALPGSPDPGCPAILRLR